MSLGSEHRLHGRTRLFHFHFQARERPLRLLGFLRFLFPNFFHALYDLARIIELSSAQLDRTEIANFVPVSWAMANAFE